MGSLAGTGAGCVFCAIARGDAPADVLARDDDTVTFYPLNPVTPGHVLVVPTVHVADLAEDVEVTAQVFHAAASLVALLRATAGLDHANLITSMGAHATQTITHLHVHVIPRREGDGLTLPWTPDAAARHLDYLGKLYLDRLAEAADARAMIETGRESVSLLTPLGEPLVHALAAAAERTTR